jgi:p-hydroxybenzoate 3-monooxygenase
LHSIPDTDDFGLRMQQAELDTLTHLESAARSFAEHYAGLAF